MFSVSSVPECVAVDAAVEDLSSGSVEETITTLSLLTACWRPAILTEVKVNIQEGVSGNTALCLRVVAEVSCGVHARINLSLSEGEATVIYIIIIISVGVLEV